MLTAAYYYQTSVKQNHQKAFEYFKHAADQGYANAHFETGNCYENGFEVE